jgi:hypothetical protein
VPVRAAPGFGYWQATLGTGNGRRLTSAFMLAPLVNRTGSCTNEAFRTWPERLRLWRRHQAGHVERA